VQAKMVPNRTSTSNVWTVWKACVRHMNLDRSISCSHHLIALIALVPLIFLVFVGGCSLPHLLFLSFLYSSRLLRTDRSIGTPIFPLCTQSANPRPRKARHIPFHRTDSAETHPSVLSRLQHHPKQISSMSQGKRNAIFGSRRFGSARGFVGACHRVCRILSLYVMLTTCEMTVGCVV
jgi:hypothetical protein